MRSSKLRITFWNVIMDRLIILAIGALLASCSAGNLNCSNSGCAAINGALMVKDIYSQDPPKKCKVMAGEQRKECEQQVEAVKNSIAKENKV